MKKIPINLPLIGKEEQQIVLNVLKSGVLTNKSGQGPMVHKFENNFSNYIGCRYAIATNSGTSALHAALLALDLKPRDEVIVPSFTFVATATIILHVHAKVVFADIEPETFTLDPIKINKVISKNTKVIIPVHLFGHPADMKPLIEIAEDKNIFLLEDACQAHGSEYRGKKSGNLSDAACFSFYPSKNMTTGEGGIITTNNEEFADKIRMIINHGENKAYNTIRLGHNFRMPEISAAIGIEQLKKLPEFINKRAKNASYFNLKLNNINELRLPIEKKWAKHSWYMYTLTIKDKNIDRNLIVKSLNDSGIGAGVYYQIPLHLMPFFQKMKIKNDDLSITEQISKKVFSIPVHPALSNEDLDFINEKLQTIIKKQNE
ncbi:MAG: DegT/DnrJ/EryC1/StrS family aminotransferase [Candidatus Helarchaeota archaeon]